MRKDELLCKVLQEGGAGYVAKNVKIYQVIKEVMQEYVIELVRDSEKEIKFLKRQKSLGFFMLRLSKYFYFIISIRFKLIQVNSSKFKLKKKL